MLTKQKKKYRVMGGKGEQQQGRSHTCTHNWDFSLPRSYFLRALSPTQSQIICSPTEAPPLTHSEACSGSCEQKHLTVPGYLLKDTSAECRVWTRLPRWMYKQRRLCLCMTLLWALAKGLSCSGKHWADSLYKSQEVHANKLPWRKKTRQRSLSWLRFTVDLHRRRNHTKCRWPGKGLWPMTRYIKCCKQWYSAKGFTYSESIHVYRRYVTVIL